MDFYIYRNSTLENIFGTQNFKYSGYGDISTFDSQSDVYVWLYFLPVDLTVNALLAELDSYFERVKLICNQLSPSKTFVVFTIKKNYVLKFEQSDFRIQLAIQHFNANIIQLASEYSNVKIFDIENFTDNYSANDLFDWKHYFLSKTILHPRLAKAFKTWFLGQIDALNFSTKKCMVLDLDNTLWAGVLGEDGIDGIKIGGEYPGNAFYLFQQSLLGLSENGVILAVASKNNESDVLSLWQKHPFLLLKKEHFAAIRINWKNKAENIQELANELNIGLDSLVFVDDNPVERELVKTALPQVEVPDFPKHAYLLPQFFKQMLEQYFLQYKLTSNDKIRNQQYKDNVERKQLKTKTLDMEAYLAGLEMQLNIQQANAFSLSRVSQMTQKTNQFNLTTKRYTESEMTELMQHADRVFCANVSDKFGDNGIAIMAIVNSIDAESIEIDSFLMSCRVIGRGIEHVFVNWLLNEFKQKGYKHVFAHYKPTAKNAQVAHFWDNVGFELITDIAQVKSYKLDLAKFRLNIPTYYKISYC